MSDIEALFTDATLAPEIAVEANEPTEAVAPPEESKEEPFEGSKKEENAIARLKKQRNSLQYDLKVAREKNAELERLRNTPPPKQEDFDDWDKFQDAKIDYKTDLKAAETEVKQAGGRVQNAEDEWTEERQAIANVKGAELEKTHPAIAKTVQDNFHIIANFPPEIKKALLEADDAPLVLANLAMEGRLEELATMSITRAAIEIGKAESKPLPVKKQTQAPAPLTPSRGNVDVGVNVNSMSGDDLLKLIRKR